MLQVSRLKYLKKNSALASKLMLVALKLKLGQLKFRVPTLKFLKHIFKRLYLKK